MSRSIQATWAGKLMAALIVAGFAMSGSKAAYAATWYVDERAPIGGDGSSWLLALQQLQDAIAIAQPGDEIRIAQGVYRPARAGGDVAATFQLLQGVLIRGGFAGLEAPDPEAFDPVLFETVLSGDLNNNDDPRFTNIGDNSIHVITADAVDDSAVLHGVTIAHGNATLWNSPADNPIGAGLWCRHGASPVIEQCVFRSNVSRHSGGGLYADSGLLTLRSCRFIGNATLSESWELGGAGAFVHDALMEECEFLDNICRWPHGAASGGGVRAQGSVTMSKCTFTGNYADFGAAVWCGNQAIVRMIACTVRDQMAFADAAVHNRGMLLLQDCLFSSNFAENGSGAVGNQGVADAVNCRFLSNRGYHAGGVGNSGAMRAVNCLFSGNRADLHGGGATNAGAMLLANCTVVGNVALNDFVPGLAKGGGVYNDSALARGQLQVANCIIWDNFASGLQNETAQIWMRSGSLSIMHTCLMNWSGSYGGTANFGANPLMQSPRGRDNIYGTLDDDPRLIPGSPCRDAAHIDSLPADFADLDGDGNTTEYVPFDLDLRQRVWASALDIGAYEFHSPSCTPDIAPPAPGGNGDGFVNINDLLAVVGAWGACPAPCPADINGDNIVDVNDLLALIGAWGPCP